MASRCLRIFTSVEATASCYEAGTYPRGASCSPDRRRDPRSGRDSMVSTWVCPRCWLAGRVLFGEMLLELGGGVEALCFEYVGDVAGGEDDDGWPSARISV